MKKRTFIILLSILALLSSVYMIGIRDTSKVTFGKTTLVRGSQGGDVYELQGRLKYLGFYKGKIDGKFGWSTYWAIRNFQYKFGMKIDGVAGSKTKYMLWKATKNWRSSYTVKKTTTTNKSYSTKGFSENDIRIISNAVYGESRGEPYVGQVAVAAVILNRIKNPAFPNTPSGVIFEPGAFTAVADGQIWLTPNTTARKAVLDAISGWDPSGGAIYYFNPNTATSPWIWSRPQIKKIGQHIFCR